jgi:hypothetical protein
MTIDFSAYKFVIGTGTLTVIGGDASGPDPRILTAQLTLADTLATADPSGTAFRLDDTTPV